MIPIIDSLVQTNLSLSLLAMSSKGRMEVAMCSVYGDHWLGQISACCESQKVEWRWLCVLCMVITGWVKQVLVVTLASSTENL